MRIDNLSTVSGDIGLINSASFLAGSVPTLVQAQNASAQLINHNTGTTITNWTNLTAQNAAEWNPTTGVFTATKAGTYSVSAHLFYVGSTANAIGNEANVGVSLNSNAVAVASNTATTTSAVDRPTGFASVIVNLVPTDTIRIISFQNLGGPRSLSTNFWRTVLSINEIPGRITRV